MRRPPAAVAASLLLLPLFPAAAAAGDARAGEPAVSSDEDVKRLFATTCGYCHQGGGREEGRGPRLMGTTRNDEYLVNRIATGKPGRMPAYGRSLTLEQIEAVIRYIRGLRPEGGG